MMVMIDVGPPVLRSKPISRQTSNVRAKFSFAWRTIGCCVPWDAPYRSWTTFALDELFGDGRR